MEITPQTPLEPVGSSELTPLGKRIEMLRIERGLSKQELARAARVSRQQLWRVLAGKSELTGALCDRLALVLRIDAGALRSVEVADGGAATGPVAWLGATLALGAQPGGATRTAASGVAAAPASFGELVVAPALIRAILERCPTCDQGMALKRAVLDAVETIALQRQVVLPSAFFELRRAVLAREL